MARAQDAQAPWAAHLQTAVEKLAILAGQRGLPHANHLLVQLLIQLRTQTAIRRDE